MLCGLALILHLSLCAATCIHDDIKPEKTAKATINYAHAEAREKRSGDKRLYDGYEPLRITAQYYQIEDELLPEHQEKLKRVVTRAINKAMDLFSGECIKILIMTDKP